MHSVDADQQDAANAVSVVDVTVGGYTGNGVVISGCGKVRFRLAAGGLTVGRTRNARAVGER